MSDTADLEAFAAAVEVASGRNGPLRVDVTPASVTAVPGEGVSFAVEVTNTADVIRSFTVAVLGLDETLVLVDQPAVVLFPDERRTVTVTVHPPEGYPAGVHHLAVEVTDGTEESERDRAAIVDVAVRVPARPRLEVRAEPGTVFTGRRATFTGRISNVGNCTADVELGAADPENKVAAVFTPPVVLVPPGQDAVVRFDVTGKRPWMGAPLVRRLTVTARHRDSDGEVTASDVTTVSMVQRPRLGRRLFALAGLLMTVSVLGLVFTASFKKVADATKANEALLKQSLGADVTAPSGVQPAGVAGSVLSATGAGIEGVAVELFDVARGGQAPVRAAVTDASGAFRVSGIAPAVYRVRVTAAGFGALWLGDTDAFAEATDVEVEAAAVVEGLVVKLVGRPAALAGKVIGEDLTGVTVTVRLPADGSSAEAVVKTVAVGGDGAFALADLPAPATYEIVAVSPTAQSERRTLVLGAGTRQEALTLLLQPGSGLVAGRVVDAAGAAISGATVTLTEGTAVRTTLTLSGAGDTAGRFEVRNLRTPGTYSLTVEAAGYVRESRTIALGATEQRADVTIPLLAATGTLGGTVVDAAGNPIGGVSVTIVAGDVQRTTQTLSVVNPLSAGVVGSWRVEGLPVPGAFTVTFSGPNLAGQTLALELTATQPTRLDSRVTLASSVATVRGLVRELDAPADPPTCNPDDAVVTDCPGRLAGVSVTLASTALTLRTLTADIPTGAYRFDNVAPGTYTLTFARVGSSPQTLSVELRAGDDREIGTIALERQAGIAGTVTANGVGLPNVGVRIYRIGTYPNVVAATAVTDARGRFQVVGLDAPETYVIEFQVPAGGPVRVSRTLFLRPGESGVVDVAL